MRKSPIPVWDAAALGPATPKQFKRMTRQARMPDHHATYPPQNAGTPLDWSPPRSCGRFFHRFCPELTIGHTNSYPEQQYNDHRH